MARPVTTLVIFFLCLNTWAVTLAETGAADELGIETDVGHEQLVTELDNKDVPSGSGIGETLFGLYNMLAGFINGVFTFATAGTSMLGNIGVPGHYVTMLETIFGVLTIIDLVSFYKGWGL